MPERLMLLPSKDVSRIRLVTVPADMSPYEAYRYVTGLVSEVERTRGDQWLEDVLDLLEDKGFAGVEFALGPPLD
jgi:hypothetical protein